MRQPETLRVLVIDDSDADARLIHAMLARSVAERFEVEAETTLEQGIRRLDEERFDVVLLDLSLPESTGLETFRRIHEHQPQTAVVVLTGLDDDDLARRAVSDGAQDFLVKGRFDRGGLVRALRYAVERNQLVAELRALDEARSEFIANASHELRSPLAAFTASASLLSEYRHRMSEEELDASFGRLERQAALMTELIESLLDLARLERGAVVIEPEPVNVRTAVDRALQAVPPQDGQRVDVAVDGAEVTADLERLQQVLTNLLVNAYRYGGEDILVRSEVHNGSVVIRVSDDGSGVPPELVPKLFDPFTRGANAVGRTGTGLGLAIVRRIVEELGGSVSYEDAPDGGACFVIELPRARSV